MVQHLVLAHGAAPALSTTQVSSLAVFWPRGFSCQNQTGFEGTGQETEETSPSRGGPGPGGALHCRPRCSGMSCPDGLWHHSRPPHTGAPWTLTPEDSIARGPAGDAAAPGSAPRRSMADPCSVPPEVLVPSTNRTLALALGTRVALNCTVRWVGAERCLHSPAWSKDGQRMGSSGRQDSAWFVPNASEQLLSTVLRLNLTHHTDYGLFACRIGNATATFTLRRAGLAAHVPVVLAAILLLVLLILGAALYVRCRLNVLLWYQNRYGELEINDGKLYDAFVSHTAAPDDRSFVHFIVKPQLEKRYGYKLLLDEGPILPNAEPSAELIMNVSRCRRLIVVLSVAYLAQDWCTSRFREGLWRLLELSRNPIFIIFESRYREIHHPAITVLKQHRGTLTLLLWRAGSMSPSSDFWKELCLSLPRTVPLRGAGGDPQTRLQEDRDPMLTLPGGAPHADALPQWVPRSLPPPRIAAVPPTPGDAQRPEIDVSDLGSRNYGARTDFYCLVTEDEV